MTGQEADARLVGLALADVGKDPHVVGHPAVRAAHRAHRHVGRKGLPVTAADPHLALPWPPLRRHIADGGGKAARVVLRIEEHQGLAAHHVLGETGQGGEGPIDHHHPAVRRHHHEALRVVLEHPRGQVQALVAAIVAQGEADVGAHLVKQADRVGVEEAGRRLAQHQHAFMPILSADREERTGAIRKAPGAGQAGPGQRRAIIENTGLGGHAPGQCPGAGEHGLGALTPGGHRSQHAALQQADPGQVQITVLHRDTCHLMQQGGGIAGMHNGLVCSRQGLVKMRHAPDVAGVVAGRLQVVAGADEAGEDAIPVEKGSTMIGDPVIAAIGGAQAIFADQIAAGGEGLAPRLETGLPILRVHPVRPAAALLLGQAAAGEVIPGAVEPVAVAVGLGPPGQMGKGLQHGQMLVAGAGQLPVAGAQGEQQLVEGLGQLAEFIPAHHRYGQIAPGLPATGQDAANGPGRAQHIARHHQVEQTGHRAEHRPQPQGQLHHGILRGLPQAAGIEAQLQHPVLETPVLPVGTDQQQWLQHIQAAFGHVQAAPALAGQQYFTETGRDGRIQGFCRLSVETMIACGHHTQRRTGQQGYQTHVPGGAKRGDEAAQIGGFASGLRCRIDRRHHDVGALVDQGAKTLQDAGVEDADQQHQAHRPYPQQRPHQAPAQGQEARLAHMHGLMPLRLMH